MKAPSRGRTHHSVTRPLACQISQTILATIYKSKLASNEPEPSAKSIRTLLPPGRRLSLEGAGEGVRLLPHVTLGRVDAKQAPEQLEVLKQLLFIFKGIEKQQFQNLEQVFEKYF